MIGIYKITSPTGKVYIGQSIDIEYRWYYHKRSNRDSLLRRSFDKYGVDKHTFEVIEECGENDLNIKERYWQDFYNVIEEGLNLVLQETNEKIKIESQETKNKRIDTLKKWHKEIGHSDETRRKMSNTHKGVLKGPHKNRTKRKISDSLYKWHQQEGHSDKTKKKISTTLKGKETFVCDRCGYTYKLTKKQKHLGGTMCAKRAKRKYCRIV